jgi:hypothetical protein
MRFYFDEHTPRPVATALIARGHEVIMAVDVGMEGKDDDTKHLPYAVEQEAVMVTRDLACAGRTSKYTDHAGMICWTGAQQDIGGMVRTLLQFAQDTPVENLAGRVFWLK